MLQSAYISMRVDIRPGAIADLAARWHHGLERMRWSPRIAPVSDGFWLSSQELDSAPGYEVPGLVWAYGRPVPLLLECNGWSKTQSEIGVSPNTLSWPVGTTGYGRRVAAALECVTRALLSAANAVDAQTVRARGSARRPELLWPALPLAVRSPAS